MGYRKGYFKKDGTYVQGHFTRTRSGKYGKGNGCVVLLFLMVALIVKLYS